MNKKLDYPAIIDTCLATLAENDRGSYTSPNGSLYPHQWLWDSCFNAIGIRHIDVARAQQEIESILEGQWSNGMVPHMIFDSSPQYHRDRAIWSSWLSPNAPDDLATSGITQPPIIAEAVWRVGELLPKLERKAWFARVLPALINYHTWLYRERDPHNDGLTFQIHPWEVGLDNTPPWMDQLREHHSPWWATAIVKLKLEPIINKFRRDTRKLPAGTRIRTLDALLIFDVIRRLRRKQYDINKILHRSLFVIEDLSFNAMLARNNQLLAQIAKTARWKLPEELTEHFSCTENALEALWDDATGQYYSRDFLTFKLIMQPTIATFLPLYAGTASPERARILVELLRSKKHYGLAYPVPSVPKSSPVFSPYRYWQGPTWINTNWLIADGLDRYGYTEDAEHIRQKSVELVALSGTNEYFSPLDGVGYGSEPFSWTAALTLDVIRRQQPELAHFENIYTTPEELQPQPVSE
jgi:hypothetical protein